MTLFKPYELYYYEKDNERTTRSVESFATSAERQNRYAELDATGKYVFPRFRGEEQQMTMAEKFMVAVREYVQRTNEKSYDAIWEDVGFRENEWLFDAKTFDNDIQPKVYFTDGTAIVWNEYTEQFEYARAGEISKTFMRLIQTFPQFAGKFVFDNPTEDDLKKAMKHIMRKMINQK
jgi:uncharacterized protein YxeA